MAAYAAFVNLPDADRLLEGVDIDRSGSFALGTVADGSAGGAKKFHRGWSVLSCGVLIVCMSKVFGVDVTIIGHRGVIIVCMYRGGRGCLGLGEITMEKQKLSVGGDHHGDPSPSLHDIV